MTAEIRNGCVAQSLRAIPHVSQLFASFPCFKSDYKRLHHSGRFV